MTDDNLWPVVHEYKRLVDAKRVPAIMCPDDDTIMYSVSTGKEYTPGYKCMTCGVVYLIGTHILDQMKRNMAEAYGTRTYKKV